MKKKKEKTVSWNQEMRRHLENYREMLIDRIEELKNKSGDITGEERETIDELMIPKYQKTLDQVNRILGS